MNKDQFIYWLKGFAKAVNEEGPTPGQWGIIALELSKIKDCPDYGSEIDNEFTIKPDRIGGGWVTTSTTYKANLPKDANVSYNTNQLELDLD
jgi:hypothetical protein